MLYRHPPFVRAPVGGREPFDVHGFTGEDVYRDEEGLQTVRNLARNMAFMIRAIRGAEMKREARTHFIR